ncbi:hypothetical protein CONLIGDRAFT_687813 [Coniochaeta ligniaria NRRL 30616]|uniref:Uncharacterized protein n=1 Tax=Coniochaeta ligniaria NRRL 30616 TaxID=1408157 RepID=A0A1J7I459_9PEZI|nr:hypothetical protein CONLIGDRAFT_687813 [Coniochaeta ligniaria NRRL 30616]
MIVLIKSAEDLLQLTYLLHELWIIGLLRKPGEGEREVEATIGEEAVSGYVQRRGERTVQLDSSDLRSCAVIDEIQHLEALLYAAVQESHFSIDVILNIDRERRLDDVDGDPASVAQRLGSSRTVQPIVLDLLQNACRISHNDDKLKDILGHHA